MLRTCICIIDEKKCNTNLSQGWKMSNWNQNLIKRKILADDISKDLESADEFIQNHCQEGIQVEKYLMKQEILLIKIDC